MEPALHNDLFLMYVRNMYYENCKERADYGEKPYETLKSYLKTNRNFLESQYKLQKK